MSGREGFSAGGGRGGASGGGGGGSGDLGLREVKNPSFSGQPVSIGGVQLSVTEAEQSGGQDVPTEPLEGGYDVSGRNIIIPESGTLTGAVSSDGLGALKSLYRQQEPVVITTPEGIVDQCYVEDVTRTRSGENIDAYVVEVTYKQVFLAETGTTTVQAITPDGKATGGSGESGNGNEGFVQSESAAVAADDDPTTNGPGGRRGAVGGSGLGGGTGGGDALVDAANYIQANENPKDTTVGRIADSVTDWATSDPLGLSGGGGDSSNDNGSDDSNDGGG